MNGLSPFLRRGMSAQRAIDEIAKSAYKRAGLFTGTVALPTGDCPQRCLFPFFPEGLPCQARERADRGW